MIDRRTMVGEDTSRLETRVEELTAECQRLKDQMHYTLQALEREICRCNSLMSKLIAEEQESRRLRGALKGAQVMVDQIVNAMVDKVMLEQMGNYGKDG